MEILQLIDWNFVLPFLTLILGFLLGYGKDYLDRRRMRNNFKTLISGEIAYNAGYLEGVTRFPPEDILFATEFLITTYYDANITRLELLNKGELKLVSGFYTLIDHARRAKNVAEKGTSDDDFFGIKKQTYKEFVLDRLTEAYDFAEAALEKLKYGKIQSEEESDYPLKTP